MAMPDSELLSRFTAGTLTQFPHADHLRVAYAAIDAHGLQEATGLVCNGILAIATAAGAPGKFHMTRTVAWLRLVASAMNGCLHASSTEFLDHHSHLLRGNLLDDYYLPGALLSDTARAVFVEPEGKALD